jgi:Spy/CpxP family protein refolding chaperone
MKFTVFIALFFTLALGSMAALAQDEDTGARQERKGQRHQGARRQRDPGAHLTEALNLSDDQAAEIDSIFAGVRADHESLRDAQQEERCARRAEVDSQIAGVLNDDQLVQYGELKAERSAKMAERTERMATRTADRGEGDGGQRGERGKRSHRGPPMDAC